MIRAQGGGEWGLTCDCTADTGTIYGVTTSTTLTTPAS